MSNEVIFNSSQEYRGRESVWTPPNTNNESELHDWALTMWRRMDRDNSGSLSREELDCQEFFHIVRSVLLPDGGTGMAKNPKYARSEMDLHQSVEFCLRKADINKDAKLSFEEFKAFIFALRQPQLAVHTANLIFSLFDVDRDQTVDEFEFRQIYRFYLGHNPTEAEFQDEWARLDFQNKGRVSRRQYTKWLQTSANPIFRQHSPSPTSAYISGKADFHASRKEFLQTTPGAKRLAPLNIPKQEEVPPWRPWHSCTHMCWAKVSQKRHNVSQGEDQLQMSKSCSQLSQSAPLQLAEPSRSSSQGSIRSKAKRSYVMHAVPSMRSTKRDMDDRPSWNQRLAVSNWSRELTIINGKSNPMMNDLGGKPQRNSTTINIVSKPTPVVTPIDTNGAADGDDSGTAALAPLAVAGSLHLSGNNADTLFADDAPLTAVAYGIAKAACIDATYVVVDVPNAPRLLGGGYKVPGGSTVRLDYLVTLPKALPIPDQEAAILNIMNLTTAQLNTSVKQKFKSLEICGTPELMPLRSKFNYGRMKNPGTGKKEHWRDNWQGSRQLKDKYVSGTLDFCCPGPPPRHLYLDEYYET